MNGARRRPRAASGVAGGAFCCRASRAASRRPGAAEETDACFIVRDANGQALAYVYFGQRSGLLDVIRLWSSF